MIPQTVPNKPINGETVAVVARSIMLRSKRVISSLMPNCRLRSKAVLLVSAPRPLIWRSTSVYPKSKTPTSGDDRYCSLAAATACKPGAFLKARKKFLLASLALRKVFHLEKMTAQETNEKIARIAIIAFGSSPEASTNSQIFNCRKITATCDDSNPSPFTTIIEDANHFE